MANFACLLSLIIGFLSLSQEILWVRVVTFISKGLPQSFALVLFCFLVGIAAGAAIGKRFCERHTDLLRTSAMVLAVAAMVDLSVVLLLPVLVQILRPVGFVGIMLLVTLTALLKSIMFPIAHHLGAQPSGARIGRSVSRVYFFNIIGSTLGPIVTGYILLDYLTFERCLWLIGLGTGALSLLCAARGRTLTLGLASAAGVLPLAILVWSMAPSVVPTIAIATQKEDFPPGSRIEHVVQNRHGIIYTATAPDGEPDWVFGGNVYDGRVAVDMQENINGLERPLVLLAVHPQPHRVLVIGLSTGAWARILSASPRIKELVAVEINPGYLQVIRGYPQVAGLLSDPRVEIVADDGRRWLRRHRDDTFDLIVMNTSFFWRAYATNLLSREFMQLVAAHLKPGGILAINSTYSSDVLETARQVFPFVERRANFIYASKVDFARPPAGAEQAFRELRLNDKPVFEESAFHGDGLVRSMIDSPFMPRDQQYAGLTPAPGVITDQNLLVEYAHGNLRKLLPRFYEAVAQVRTFIHR
ncbi:methyltransferase domain-containing protein [uncultured Thiodictyon sp.]|uniref:spermine/spermidine synthase domain-containing protein n=1 Tax=uncultured Thiodictyon sp. TaxID=1846217 RepID=UPI0025E75DB3|nr:methyltransferase domain-containing protein [uncultured Thiodictyon sp.]